MATIDLSERPLRRQDLAAWYSQALAEQQASGLSVSEYAAGLGVTATTLYQWKRRLSARTPMRRRRVKRAEPGGLIQVSLGERPALEAPAAFVVRLAGDRCVEVPSHFDDEALRRLLAVLDRC